MAWANFLILGVGGALVSVPIILHFMMQPKPKELMFPALRFVKQRQQSNRSRLRLRHMLLLLLRCLLIALMAIALAGPSVASQEFGNWLTLGGIGFSTLLVAIVLGATLLVARKRNWLLIGILSVVLFGHLVYGGLSAIKLMNSESAQLLGDSQAPIAALVIVDTSPRMTYVQESTSRLEEAIMIGDWLLGQLPSDSQVSVVATDNDQPFFSVDVGAAKKRLDTLEITYQSGTIPTAIADGLRLIQQSELERKEVYVITDLTKRSWNAEESGKIARALDADPGISVFVIDVGIEDPQNFAVAPLELSNEAVTSTGGLEIKTNITHLGPMAQRTVNLKIEKPDPDKIRPIVRDGKLLVPESHWQQTINLDVPENSSAPVQFKFSESLPVGTYHGTVEVVGQDALPIDNQQHFTFQVRKSWKALAVYPDDVIPENLSVAITPSNKSSSFYGVFECKNVKQSQMMVQEGFGAYEAIFILNPEPIQATTWKMLEEYVEAGGGLAIFLGHNAASGPLGPYPEFTTEAAQRVLTGALTRQWNRPIDDPVFISPDNLEHPVMRYFKKRAEDVPWTDHPVFKYWGLEADQLDEEFPTSVILRYGNQQPALIERQIGNGRVLVMTTPITEPRTPENNRKRWNDLFLGYAWPAFALTREIANHLVEGSADRLNLQVGQIASMKNDPNYYPETYNVFSPRKDVRPTQLNASNQNLRYRFTDTPGHYRLKGLLMPVLRGFSVNLDLADTDLTRIDKEQLDSFFGADRYQLAKQKNEIQRKQGTSRRGKEFFPLLIVILMVVLGIEQLMSNRFYSSGAS